MTGAAHLPRAIRNPYRVPRPAVISFSGGRTSSAYMLKTHRRRLWGSAYPVDIACGLQPTLEWNVKRRLQFVDVCGREWGV